MYEKESIWVKVNKDGKVLKAFSSPKFAAAAEVNLESLRWQKITLNNFK